MTRAEIQIRMSDQPFKPFRMHLSDGSRLDVVDSGMFVIGEDSVVLPSVWTKDDEGLRFAKHWRTIAISHIVQIGEIDEMIEHKRRKRR